MAERVNPIPEDFHTITPHLVVRGVARAVSAGAEELMPVQDCFWGDRYGILADPFGHRWLIASRIEDLSPAETHARSKDYFAGGSAEGGTE